MKEECKWVFFSFPDNCANILPINVAGCVIFVKFSWDLRKDSGFHSSGLRWTQLEALLGGLSRGYLPDKSVVRWRLACSTSKPPPATSAGVSTVGRFLNPGGPGGGERFTIKPTPPPFQCEVAFLERFRDNYFHSKAFRKKRDIY